MAPYKAQYKTEGSVLKVTGKLDFAEEEGLRRAGMGLLAKGEGEIILDLSKVTYISSSCLGEILVLDEECKKKGRLFKVLIPRALLYVYDLMGIRSVVNTDIVE